MKTAVIAAAMLTASVAAAGPGGNRDRNESGADAFRDVVVQCLVAGMEAGATDPNALAEQCVEAAQTIWAASYPSAFCPHFGP